MAGKNPRLKYGEGQREQYGEGMDYRPEDKTEAVRNKHERGFAGGERDEKPLPDAQKPADACR